MIAFPTSFRNVPARTALGTNTAPGNTCTSLSQPAVYAEGMTEIIDELERLKGTQTDRRQEVGDLIKPTQADREVGRLRPNTYSCFLFFSDPVWSLLKRMFRFEGDSWQLIREECGLVGGPSST